MAGHRGYLTIGCDSAYGNGGDTQQYALAEVILCGGEVVIVIARLSLSDDISSRGLFKKTTVGGGALQLGVASLIMLGR
ncbi:hypothetical protein N4G58_00285 [Edwardsiella piscicida]|nr:hypothetical protein N4G58_00285 [Edwardsiella piscicida]